MDIRLVWSVDAADISIVDNDIEGDEGLETSVLLSLFADARAEDSDTLPQGTTDRKGWWADQFLADDGDHFGSRLWLLSREKQTPETLERAIRYTEEALQWLLDDKVASAVDVTAEYASGVDPATPKAMVLSIVIERPTGDVIQFKYDYNWQAQAMRS